MRHNFSNSSSRRLNLDREFQSFLLDLDLFTVFIADLFKMDEFELSLGTLTLPFLAR